MQSLGLLLSCYPGTRGSLEGYQGIFNMMMRRFRIARVPEERSSRTGILSIWAVIAMLVCLCCVALVANTGYISGLRSESKHCAQAAALAAARTVLTDDILKSDPQLFEIEARYLRAREAAMAVGAMYGSRADLPTLGDQHVAIGTVVSAEAGTTFLRNSIAPNRVQVVVTNAAEDDFSGQLLFSGLSGLSHAKILSHATVGLENRIVGFRASGNAAVPMIMLAIPDSTDSSASGFWSSDIEANGGSDRFEWSGRDGVVNRSADRLPEIVISLKSNQRSAGPGQGRWLVLQTGDDLPLFVAESWTSGVRASSGNEHAMLSFPVSAIDLELSNPDIFSIAMALQRIVGQPRIFPLYSADPTVSDLADGDEALDPSTDDQAVTLTRPVAARIVHVEVLADDELQITLQPCVLSTSTALTSTDESVPANRYIWRIGLME